MHDTECRYLTDAIWSSFNTRKCGSYLSNAMFLQSWLTEQILRAVLAVVFQITTYILNLVIIYIYGKLNLEWIIPKNSFHKHPHAHTHGCIYRQHSSLIWRKQMLISIYVIIYPRASNSGNLLTHESPKGSRTFLSVPHYFNAHDNGMCVYVCVYVCVCVCHSDFPDDLTKDWCHTSNIMQAYRWDK